MIKKVLVTGADGLLGSNLVRELLSRGYKVRALLLPNSPSSTLNGLDIERHTGNILKSEDIQSAMEGCNYLVHAAANTNIWPNRSEIVRRVNLEGTQNIAKAALAAGIKRMVYIGTANSFGFGFLTAGRHTKIVWSYRISNRSDHGKSSYGFLPNDSNLL